MAAIEGQPRDFADLRRDTGPLLLRHAVKGKCLICVGDATSHLR